MNLTINEKRILTVMLDEGIGCNGAETIHDVLEDNMTWADVQSLSEDTGMDLMAVRGTVGSLAKKGLLVGGNENTSSGIMNEQVLTNEGVKEAWELVYGD